MSYHGREDLGACMFIVVWQFEIAEEKIAAFEAAYSPEGAWAQLFRTSPEYRGTELLRDAYIPGTYFTIDRWRSEEAFRAFRKDHDRSTKPSIAPATNSPAAKPVSAHTASRACFELSRRPRESS